MQENGKLALKSIRIPDSRIWMSFIDHFSFVVYKTTMGYLRNRIQFSHKKKNILPFATARMDLENIMLSEISQSEKDKYHMISLICGI